MKSLRPQASETGNLAIVQSDAVDSDDTAGCDGRKPDDPWLDCSITPAKSRPIDCIE